MTPQNLYIETHNGTYLLCKHFTTSKRYYGAGRIKAAIWSRKTRIS